MTGKEQKIEIIQTQVRKLLDPENPKGVKYDKLVSEFVAGGAGAIPSFIEQLNDTEPFKHDGMNLLPGSVPDDPRVYELISAILENYKSRGWKLIMPPQVMTNLNSVSTINQLATSVRGNSEFEQQLRDDPSQVLEQISANQIPNTRVYHIVVFSLGAAILAALVGAILITLQHSGAEATAKEIPDILVAVSSAAVGALAGLLAPQPDQAK